MVYQEKPPEFHAHFEIVSSFVEHDGEILLLHRQTHKPQGGTWGVPAGKVDLGESVMDAMVRELHEETSLYIPPSSHTHKNTVFVTFPEHNFIYHMFHTPIRTRQEISLNPEEHTDYTWASPQKALTMPLIQDLDACIQLFYKL